MEKAEVMTSDLPPRSQNSPPKINSKLFISVQNRLFLGGLGVRLRR